MVENNPFFEPEDFESIKFEVQGTNLTSHMQITAGTIHVLQILGTGIWLDVPLKSCAAGHTLALDVVARKSSGTPKRGADGNTPEELVYFENRNHVTGVVEEIDSDKTTFLHVKLVFRQFAQDQWNTLLQKFSEKQANVNQLLKASRK